MTSASRYVVQVQRSRGGRWEVALRGRDPVACESLDDAKRIAYRLAARSHACELIVHDAYHRVLRREMIDGNTPRATGDAQARDAGRVLSTHP